MHAKLIIVGGKANRAEIRLKLPMIVGRGRDAGIVIAHPTVSRQHCELFEDDGKVFVRDLGSLNGTLVADQQVQRGCLEHGTLLTVGPLTFQMVYEHLGAIPASSAPAADDTVLPEAPTGTPELAQTIVDMPRLGRVELEEPVSSDETLRDAPLVVLSADDEFDLDLPLPADDETIPAPDAAAPRTTESAAAETHNLFTDDQDDLGFELAAAPVPEDATVELAPPDEEIESAAPKAAPTPTVAANDDDFLAMMAEETDLAETKSVETVEFDVDEAPRDADVESEASASTPPAEEELDWLEDTMVEPPATDELTDLDDALPSVAVTELMDEVEELTFDESESSESDPTPAAAVEPAPQPAPKKKRGLWPFGRKKPAPEAIVEELVEAPIELETPDEEPLIGEETVVMDILDLEEMQEPAPAEVTSSTSR